jgi:hypothetical protein
MTKKEEVMHKIYIHFGIFYSITLHSTIRTTSKKIFNLYNE